MSRSKRAQSVDANHAADWVESTLTYLADRSIKPVWHGSAQEDADHWHEGAYKDFKVRIHNMRPIAGSLSLDHNGFMLRRHPVAVRDFYNMDEVVTAYYPEMEALIRELSGASRVFSMFPTIRDIHNKLPYTRTFHRVHSDFTDENAPNWARSMLMGNSPFGPPPRSPVSAEEADAIMQRRYAEYNVWRPINGPVVWEPLALLDASTMAPDDVMVCTSEAGDVLHGIYNPAHKWYYAPAMENDEILIFKCYDTARDGRCRFALHSAFEHPDTPVDAPLRLSIDFRIWAFFDE